MSLAELLGAGMTKRKKKGEVLARSGKKETGRILSWNENTP